MKRLFVSFLALNLITSCASQETPEPVEVVSEPTEPPNIVFILVDDLSDAVSGLGADPVAVTPNIERLSAQGVLFTNAHANSPVCAPSRNSMLSGLYPHTTGAYNFRGWSESDMLSKATSLFGYFKDQGYVTLGSGKIHHRRGGHSQDWSVIDGDRQYVSHHDAGPWPWDGDPEEGRTIHPDQAFLLDHVDDLKSRQRMQGGSSRFLSFGALSDVPVYPANPEKGLPGYEGWRNSDGSAFRWESVEDRDRMPDERKTDFAVEVLKRDFDKPFFLTIGFNRPHEPLYLPDEYLARFPIEDVKLPPMIENDWDDIEGIPDSSRGYAFDRYEMYMRAGGTELLRSFVQHYLASVSLIDDQVGRILDAIEASGEAENTIIIFTSDHGYHIGEKGAVYKATMWQEATRVPMIVSAPGIGEAGTVSHHPVSLIDIFPTLVDLAGLPDNPQQGLENKGLDGFSLRPLLENPEGDWPGPDNALSTIYGDQNQSSELPKDHNFTLIGERWKYILYTNDFEELYDLDTDPEQWTNLAEDPAQQDRMRAFRSELRTRTGR